MMFHLVIAGGQVVSATSTATLDVAVQSGEVVAITKPGALSVVMTVARGKVIIEQGQYLSPLSDGQFVKRSISREILSPRRWRS